MSPSREKVTFDPNVPVTVTLEFDGGKQVQGRYGPQFLYWLDGQRSMFVDANVHEQIRATGAVAGDTLEITRRKKGRADEWEVVHILDEPGQAAAPPPPPQTRRPSSPVPAAATAPRPTQQPAPAPITRATTDLTAAFCQAIDALTEAREYGRRAGLDLRWDTGDVRAVAISIYIDKCKGGAR
jgi:hypothetical protein